VDIAEISDIRILEAGKRTDQLPTSSADTSRHGRADTDHREYYLVIGRVSSARIGERRQTCDGNDRSLQKTAAGERSHDCSPEAKKFFSKCAASEWKPTRPRRPQKHSECARWQSRPTPHTQKPI